MLVGHSGAYVQFQMLVWNSRAITVDGDFIYVNMIVEVKEENADNRERR